MQQEQENLGFYEHKGILHVQIQLCYQFAPPLITDGYVMASHYLPLNILILMAGPAPHPPSHHEPLARLFVAAVIPLVCFLGGPRPSLDVTSRSVHCIDMPCLVYTIHNVYIPIHLGLKHEI